MDGVLLINKEEGLSSFDVVRKLKKFLNTKKVGHCGTLDPLAKGLLVVTVGKALKISRFIESDEKEYIATIKLGIKTDTLDTTGNIVEKKDYNVDEKRIIEAYYHFKDNRIKEFPEIFGDGRAAEFICKELINNKTRS